jgi:hypothetical protein
VLAAWSEAKDGKVVVQRCCALDSQPAHDGKTRSVHAGKILIRPSKSNLPSSFKVGRTYGFDGNNSLAQVSSERI